MPIKNFEICEYIIPCFYFIQINLSRGFQKSPQNMESTDSTSSGSEIESLATFKTKRRAICIICTKENASLNVTEKSGYTFIKTSQVRESITKTRESDVNKIITDIKSGGCKNLFWHKSCYLSYTSKRNITSLQNKLQRQKQYEEAGISPPAPVGRTLRKNIFDINRCVICQKRSSEKRLSQIMSMNIEKKLKI